MRDLAKTVFLVDGPTEIRAFKAKFAKDYTWKLALRQVGCNGKDVTPQGYANAALGILVVALKSRFTTILCVVDREQRSRSATTFAGAVRDEMIETILRTNHFSRDHLEEKIFVCVPDRMFENWIVADVEGIKTYSDLVKPGAVQGDYDGQSGATVLKRIMKVRYRKTLHGPTLFKRVSFKRAKSNSPSFCRFADILGLC